MWNLLAEITPRDILDIGLVTAFLFIVLVWLKQARAGLAVLGALALALVYLLAREFRLQLTAWMLQGFFAVFVIVLVVVLQYDLRRLFERVAAWRFRGGPPGFGGPQWVETLSGAIFELINHRRGALIVLAGRDPVSRYVQGGEELDGKLSHSLLMSLFDPGSAGHDGAVVIEEGRVASFAVHLPLSTNFDQIQKRGTRHAAALGLAELTDALTIVVSEERGEVAVARDGRLRTLADDQEALRAQVLEFLGHKSPGAQRSHRGLLGKNKHWKELALAPLLTVAFWLLFASGGQVAQKTFPVPVLVDNITPEYEVERVQPKEVQVTLSGLRRDLYLVNPTLIEVRLDASLAGLGRRTFRLNGDDIRRPAELEVQEIEPQSVTLQVRRKSVPAQAAPAKPQ